MAGHILPGSYRASAVGVAERSCPATTSYSSLSRQCPPARSTPLSGSYQAPTRRELNRLAATVRTASVDDDDEESGDQPRRQQRGRGGTNRGRREQKKDDGPKKDADGFSERVLQVSRVTKVVKGGKQMSFRAVVVVGDSEGKVGVGCSSAKEVITAVEKAVADAKRHVVPVPIIRGFTFPHQIDGFACGAKVMLRPACEGTGVIAGGAVREVLEVAGFKNAFGKQLGSDNPLNNARATVDGLSRMRTLAQVARDRDLSVEEMLGHREDREMATA